MKVARPIRKAGLKTWLAHGALCLNVALGLSNIGLWLSSYQQGLAWYSDFSAFYTGWAMVRDGQGAHLYDMELQAHYQRQILEGRSLRDGFLPYVNPPHATIPFVPLSWLAHPAAYLVWTLGQLVLLAWLLYLLWQVAQPWKRQERLLLLSATLAFPPLLIALVLGTFSLYMTVCLLQCYLTLKRAREAETGLWIALGTVKPQLMLVPGLMLLGARRWRALGVALLLTGALVAISGLALGWQSWGGFIQALRFVNQLFGRYVYPDSMYNFRGTLTLLLGNQQGALINTLSTAALAVAAVVVLWLWRGRWRPDHPSFELRVALTLLVGAVFIPHFYAYDGLSLIVPGTLFYVYLRQRDLPRYTYAVFALCCVPLLLLSEFALKSRLGIQLPVVAMAVLMVWMGRALAREGQAQDHLRSASV